jgi:hypothetical protein
MDPMSLNDLCDRLHRNDPTLTIVDLMPRAYHGHGMRIGRALLQNVTVFELSFAIEKLVDRDEVFHAEQHPLLQYLRTNVVVRKISLSTCTTPFPNMVPEIDRLSGLALEAVAQNAHIASFWCFSRVPIEPMATLLASTISLTSLSLSAQHSIADDPSTLSRFAEALRMNHTLETLFLMDSSDNERLMDSFLLPLASHPKLQVICMGFANGQQTFPIALIRVLHSRSVKVSMLGFMDKQFESSSWNLLCDALKGNLSIRGLLFASCSIAVPLVCMLKLVRENGSIRAVRDDSLSYDSNHPKVVAYCQRNVQLPVLLAEAFVHGRAVGSVDGGGSSLSLLSLLLAAAQQAPRTAPNLILLALLAIPSDDIGIRPTGTRLRTSTGD